MLFSEFRKSILKGKNYHRRDYRVESQAGRSLLIRFLTLLEFLQGRLSITSSLG